MAPAGDNISIEDPGSAGRNVAEGTTESRGEKSLPGSEESAARERMLRDAILAGDEEAWKTFYDACFESLHAYVFWRMDRRAQDAEEVIQDCWMTAVRRIRAFDPDKGCFEGWLRGIADGLLSNRSRRESRRRARERSLPGVETPASSGPNPAPRADLAEEIAFTLTALPRKYQEVLRAKYEEELKVAEIARRWGEPEKAVESLLFRARAAFREAYGRLGKWE